MIIIYKHRQCLLYLCLDKSKNLGTKLHMQYDCNHVKKKKKGKTLEGNIPKCY